MREILTAVVEWTDKLHFLGKGDYGHPVPVDYSPPLGDGQGYGGLDLLLMALAACGAQTAMSLFIKMKQDVTKFIVSATGKRTTEHPTVLTDIRVDFAVEGRNLSAELIEKAIRLSDEKYCPVWAMLKPSTKITYTLTLTPIS
jgi:putative redox protein